MTNIANIKTYGYKSDDWSFIWSLPGGRSVDIGAGLSKGSFAVEAPASSTNVHKTLLNGDGVRSSQAGLDGTLTFLVDQNTIQHRELVGVYYLDRKSGNEIGTITATLVGPAGILKKYYFRGSYIMTLPGETHAETSNDVSWVFQYTSAEKTYPTDGNAVISS